MKHLKPLALIAFVLMFVAAVTAPSIFAASPHTWEGEGYGMMVDGRDHCILGYSNAALPSNVTAACQSGALLWRTDTSTMYQLASGSWTAWSPTVATLTATQVTSTTLTGNTTTTTGVGTAGTSVTATEQGNGAFHRTTLTFAAYSLAITDTGGANGGQGGAVVYTFPEGYIEHMGSTCNLTTARVSTGIAVGAAVVEALGSTAAAVGNSTLTTTEADFIASFAGTLSSGAGTFAKTGTGTLTAFDGHTTPEPLYLNAAVPDADISATDAITFTGTCIVSWLQQGDI